MCETGRASIDDTPRTPVMGLGRVVTSYLSEIFIIARVIRLVNYSSRHYFVARVILALNYSSEYICYSSEKLQPVASRTLDYHALLECLLGLLE